MFLEHQHRASLMALDGSCASIILSGGSGGTDTAGMGGKAGPYRSDGGFDIFQISQEEKAKVRLFSVHA